MSIVMEILGGLWEMELNYKGVKVNFFGIPHFLLPDKNHNKNTIYTTLSRMAKKGLIKNVSYGKWVLTEKGRKYFEYKKKILRQFYTPLKKEPTRNLLIMFDIPESRNKERYWFRLHLKKFNFVMIQKSVWVGPNPLPEDFVVYLKEIGLRDYIKQFKLAKSYKLKP